MLTGRFCKAEETPHRAVLAGDPGWLARCNRPASNVT